MNIAIVKYNAGNVRSVIGALTRLGVTPVLTDNEEELRRADKVIFPGVGEASTTMEYLRAHGLDRIIKDLKQPVLGICLGQQLMCSHSEEGNTDCLGTIRMCKALVERIRLALILLAAPPCNKWRSL